jgi:BirA family biotin operon repressor/biotin-[acetyl-CoA-carboxylase] ligase
MADAAEEVVGLPDGAIRLKWPNDLVVATEGGVRKLGGVLGESDGLGSADPRVVVGIGVNADWPRDRFPAELADGMTSLHDASHGRPIDRALLLDGFLSRLEVRVELLRDGRFDVADWTARQATTGHDVEIRLPDGSLLVQRAVGVDTGTGALVIDDGGAERHLLVGEIRHVRVAGVRPASAAGV